MKKNGIWLSLVLLLVPFTSANAQNETAPAKRGYYTYLGGFFVDGYEACMSVAKANALIDSSSVEFAPPATCSRMIQPDPRAPAYRFESKDWISEIALCPGGTVSAPLGKFSVIDSAFTCKCKPNERYFEDAISSKKCVPVTELEVTESQPTHPSDHGVTCSNDGSPSCGQPINPGTGNMWHVETDYISANSASGLTIQRTYNSNPLNWDASVARSFGKHWTQQYDVIVKPEAPRDMSSPFRYSKCWRRFDNGRQICETYPNWTPDAASLPDAVSILRGDGKKYLFNRSGRNWIADRNVGDELVAEYSSSGSKVISWKYRSGGGAIEIFDSTGRLISRSNPGGSTQQLTYSTGTSNDTSNGRLPSHAPICTNIPAGEVYLEGLLMCVTDAWGRQINFEYDSKARITKIIDPDRQVATYEYDGSTAGCVVPEESNPGCNSNNLTRVTYSDGMSRTYHYNEVAQINNGVVCAGGLRNDLGHLANALTGLTDENGSRHISWTYDCNGRATSSELGKGAEKVEIIYGDYSPYYSVSGGAQMSVVHYSGSSSAPAKTYSTWKYTKVGGMAKMTGVDAACVECGDSTRLEYDANGNISKRTSWLYDVTTYKYDLYRNLETSRVENSTSTARTISTEWHPSLRLPVRLAEPKRLTIFTYDSEGNLLTKAIHNTDDSTGVLGFGAALTGPKTAVSYTYNSLGQLLSSSGPRNDVPNTTRYEYDIEGNLYRVANPLGHSTTFMNYDKNGRVGSVINQNGIRTDYTYTSRGWLLSESKNVPGQKELYQTTYDYDGVGQITKITLPDRKVLRFKYDEAHRLIEIEDSSGNSIHYELDIMGNRIREYVKDDTGDLVRSVERTFNARKQLTSVTGSNY